MTTEFRIDKPGVYRRRDGSEVCLWPAFSESPLQWFTVGHKLPVSYKDNGDFWVGGEESEFDIVAYVGPLPADILQRMAEALDAAEYCPQQTTPATFGEALKAMAEEPAP
jgi:hypothetical protein